MIYSDDQKFLLDRDILLVNFIALSLEHYDSLSSHIEHYNEDSLHRSLDIGSYQTSLKVFSDKKAAKAIEESNPPLNGGGVRMAVRHNFRIIQVSNDQNKLNNADVN